MWKENPYEINTPGVSTGIDMATARGGVRPSPRLFSTGGVVPIASGDFADLTPVVTEIYVAELFVPCTVTCTGIAIFNGSNVTDSIKVGLFDANGTLLRATADTQQSGADAYQRIPWATNGANVAATLIDLIGPATYFIGCILDGTTSRLNSHVIGNFAQGKITGAVYSTAFNTTSLTITPPTTFTTILGPVASLY